MAARDWFVADQVASGRRRDRSPRKPVARAGRIGLLRFESNPGATSWRSSDKRAYPQRVEGRSRASGR